jgi:RHS repeat-associated protein
LAPTYTVHGERTATVTVGGTVRWAVVVDAAGHPTSDTNAGGPWGGGTTPTSDGDGNTTTLAGQTFGWDLSGRSDKAIAGGTTVTTGVTSVQYGYTGPGDAADLHGDVVLTLDLAGTAGGPLGVYDPDGQPLSPTTGMLDSDAVPDTSYGSADTAWVGQWGNQYEHAGTLALVQLGARPYLPALARFLSIDPVEGGTSNDCVYSDDPVKQYDLTGMWKVGDWLYANRRSIVQFAVGAAASVVAGAAAAAFCGATAGIGCLVVAGAATRVAVGASWHWTADRAMGYRSNWWTTFGYAAKDALGGGLAGGFTGRFGRGAVGTTLNRFRPKHGYLGARRNVPQWQREHMYRNQR